MHGPIKDQAVVLHKLQVLQDLRAELVLIALRLVLYVFETNRLFNQVPVVRCIFLSYLIVEQLQVILIEQLLYNIPEDLIKRLVTLLLPLALTPIVLKGLLIVEVFFRKPVRLEPTDTWLLFDLLRFLGRLHFKLAIVIVSFRKHDFNLIIILLRVLLYFETNGCLLRLWVVSEVYLDDWLAHYILVRLFSFDYRHQHFGLCFVRHD